MSVGQGYAGSDKMLSWRGRVLAAEASKAGIVSDDALLTPSLCVIGIEACNH